MNIRNIYSLCNSNKRITIYEQGRRQYIGNGHAAYYVEWLPEVDEESVFAVLGIPEKKKGSYQVSVTSAPEIFRSLSADDTMDEWSKITLGVVGEKYSVVYTKVGPMLLDLDYLKPIGDDEVFYYVRALPDGSAMLLATASGARIDAAISLHTMPQDTIMELQRMAQATMHADPDTGEVISHADA